jgi:hypothetical protein
MSKKILMALLVVIGAATAPAFADCCQPSAACCGGPCCEGSQ